MYTEKYNKLVLLINVFYHREIKKNETELRKLFHFFKI